MAASASAAPLLGAGAHLVGVADQPERLSLEFTKAPAAEVLAALRKAGVSLVYTEDQLTDRIVTISLKNAETSDAIESLASALSQKVERRGSVYTFKRISGSDFLLRRGGMDRMLPLDRKRAEELQGMMEGLKLPEISIEVSREMEQALRQMRESLGDLPALSTIRLRSSQIEAFRETLTEGQKKRAEGEGLMAGDLTAQQRRLLELEEGSKVRIRLRDGQMSLHGDGPLRPAIPGYRALRLDSSSFEEILTDRQKADLEAGKTLTEKDLSPEQIKKLGADGADLKLKISRKDGALSISIEIRRASV